MSTFSEKEHDPLDNLLSPPDPLPDDGALRERVLHQTIRFVRRRRRVRQLAWSAAVAACVAGVVFAARWLKPTPSPQPDLAERPHQSEPLAPEPDQSPLALEWRAFDSQDRQTELYRQAGDRYLAQGEDLQAALRCYGNALDAGTEDDLKHSAGDSWLLMAIKDAREKEKRDVPNDM
jgi:hypothetical protein